MGEINSSFVSPGDNVQFRASMINDMLQMISQWKSGHLGGNSSMNSGGRGETIFVKNTTGVDLFASDVAAIESPLFAAPEIESEDRADIYRHFLDRSYLAILPTEDKSLAIATGPIPDGQIGRVVISGVVRAKVDVKDTAHKTVTFTPNTTALESSDSGKFSFLIQPTATGKQWCDLVFGVSGGGGGGNPLIDDTLSSTLVGLNTATTSKGHIVYAPVLAEGRAVAPGTPITHMKGLDGRQYLVGIKSYATQLALNTPTLTANGNAIDISVANWMNTTGIGIQWRQHSPLGKRIYTSFIGGKFDIGEVV